MANSLFAKTLQEQIPMKRLFRHIELSTQIFEDSIKENRKFSIDYSDVILMDLFEMALDLLDPKSKTQVEKIKLLYLSHMESIGGGDAIEGWSNIGKRIKQMEKLLEK